MVSKSYSVSKRTNKNIFSVESKETCDDINFNNMQNNNEDHEKNYSKKDLGFVINVNEVKREMVNNKPSKNIIFHDDNFSSSTPSSSSMSWLWWNSNSMNNSKNNNNISMLKWNKEYIHETVNYTNIGLLIKIIAACISIALIGFIVSSLLMMEQQKDATDAVKRQRLLLNNDSIIDNTSTATPTYTQIQSTELTAASLQTIINNSNNPINDFNDNHLHSSVLPPNTISDAIQNIEHAKKSNNDEISLTKNYVERINFYTTSNKNLFSVKVLPTLPSIKKNNIKSTSELPLQNYANDCESTSLPLCQGISTYDLTDSKLKWNLTNLEYEHFQHLIYSNCSNRVHEYVCHLLEPECRPSKMKNLMPCRRICKGIFESCSHIIASSEVLTQFFDCNQYIDSNDALVCEDITRSRKKCFDDEFQCGDLSCISLKWRCDNIRDCTNGEDEEECKFCNYNEFKCLSDQKCISEKWRCDTQVDCSDGSDEANCENDESNEAYDDVYNDEGEEETNRDQEENARIFYDDIKDYSDRTSIDHNDSDGDKIISTGDDVVPIFINPNSTLISDDLQIANSSTKLSKRFRSTMRKTLETTTNTTPKVIFEETSTSVTKSVTSSHSTSHSSPCPEDHLRCVDGLCITLDQICDKIQDCSDNSDELHCEY
ncbi:hypothetical protein PVAND_003346 [Polypedilum vanderplanki]|uniref:FZ domain-containing protein n=1 Tax=Polypedilum vanderplanki TaxID=319348 RepID=A0A9J6BVI9_POLVA|nr:hypothetical protein PVAND_003346 [Polypedilum vanderplanki]